MITSSVSTLAGRFTAALAMFSLVVTPVAVSAQDAETPDAVATPPSALNPLGIPENFSLLGEANPNVRVATAVVNGTVITGTDVDQRTALIVSASRGSLSEEEVARVKMQVLRNLIDETLQVQEAAAQEIEVSSAEVNQRYEQLAVQNFGQKDAMDAYLLSIGSSPASLKRQIQGEIAWQRLIRRNIGNFVNVSEAEAQEYIKRLEESRGEEEFHVMEIYLSATSETEAAVVENARQIMEQLRAGGSFQGYARQFSEASTAAVGGDLGYVQPGTLPAPMAAAIQSMQPGQLTGPVQIPGGFVIIYLRDKRRILMADPRDAKLSLKQISIQFAPNVTEEQAGQQLDAFQAAVQSIRGCGDAERAAATVNAEVVVNDDIAVRDLPEQLQPTMLGLQVGQATPPFGSLEDGVRVLLLCGRDDPEVAGLPTVDEVIELLENERIQKRAQRYLRDLRNDAYIEYN
ncbi:peptidylprolyl isomerase [Erythrobacter sp. SDW2]|nr:peptidylprolyl isomerase [Erythrobacter sp. SDW2]UIP07928.1 peptidylprolyl isomerase [Erythrobacter sp. SDW2]